MFSCLTFDDVVGDRALEECVRMGEAFRALYMTNLMDKGSITRIGIFCGRLYATQTCDQRRLVLLGGSRAKRGGLSRSMGMSVSLLFADFRLLLDKL